MELTLRLPALDGTLHRVPVRATVRSSAPSDEAAVQHVGVEFHGLGADAENRILEYCHVLRPATVAADRAVVGPALEHHAVRAS